MIASDNAYVRDADNADAVDDQSIDRLDDVFGSRRIDDAEHDDHLARCADLALSAPDTIVPPASNCR